MPIKKHIYLDHGASTPVHPQVLEAMLPHWTENYGNSSSTHEYGRLASRALEQSRETIAGLLQAQPDEIIFTGCGSESDNLAVRGAMWAARKNNGGNHLIVSSIEHSAILNTAVQMRDLHHFDLTILPVDEYGLIDLAQLEAAIRPDTVLISIMAANNEVGTMQDIAAIGQIAHEHGVLFHSDAVQAIAVRRWDMRQMPIDLISIAPHKFYGPKGVGMLYARDRTELISELTGGGQENGRRAGTSNVPYAVGAAKSLELAMAELDERNAHYLALRDQLIDGLLAALPNDCILTGHPTERLPHNASFAFRYISGNDLLMHLDMAGIAASSGSACKSGDPKPSRTLKALGLAPEWTKGGLRLTVGMQNTAEHIAYFLEKMPAIIQKLQKLQAAN
ncbi:MAG: cysteine desulfurase [Ardenticatenaceae bacterium]|nr:cysteine desulfurase [Ardenticatenaceae bacterium]MCB9445310.1 cysteine desulfurase [Ardenticatenaceae bacterium]